jgi:hypothetical protein
MKLCAVSNEIVCCVELDSFDEGALGIIFSMVQLLIIRAFELTTDNFSPSHLILASLSFHPLQDNPSSYSSAVAQPVLYSKVHPLHVQWRNVAKIGDRQGAPLVYHRFS